MAKGKVLELDRRAVVLPGVQVGWLVGWSTGEGPVVDFPGNTKGPLAARTTVALDVATAKAAIESRQGVLLLHERGREDLPIIVGLLQPTEPIDAELPAQGTVAYVDGRRMEVEGKDEVVLRCGPASITLRANGRVVIRGTCVETRASGTNRIKGGTVQIN